MGVGSVLRNIFRFRKTSLTFLVFLTFIITIILQKVAVHNALKVTNNNTELLNFAWEHLQIISSTKHPFTSPKNDELHDYLYDVVSSLSYDVPYVEVSSDKVNNHTILINQHDVFNKSSDDNRVIFYESSNILVKIEGTDSQLSSVLLSAHFDSVPTSFGTTDDGMGIASMLAVLKHLLQSGKQPKRTLVLNFNNNEEFGLLGAEAFMKHAWANEVEFFINLEGTGAGGLPVLFRGTDKSVIDWYSNVRTPFANSIFQEGFNSGFISSQTDYHVYEKFGLRGLDIAFYLPRSFYHTYKDSIKYTSKGSLWAMASNVIDILDDVLYSSKKYNEDLNYSVYFDILNIWFFNFSMVQNFTINVLLLVTVPILLSILQLIVNRRKTWFVGIRGWSRFPVALILSYYANKLLLMYLYNLNPLLVSVNYYLPLILSCCSTLLINYLVLNLANIIKPVHEQKLIILLELNAISWISLVWMTYQINEYSNICGYVSTIVYLLTSIASLFGLLSFVFLKSPCYKREYKVYYGSSEEATDEHTQEMSNNSSEGTFSGPEVHDINDNANDNEDSDSERQPLLNESEVIIDHETRDTFMHNIKQKALNSFQYDWLIQFLILVPISVFFIYSEGILTIGALHETVQESSVYAKNVWDLVMAVGILLAIVVSPFIHKFNYVGIQITFLLFLFSLMCCYFAPFSDESTPIKFRYVKTFDATTNKSISEVYGREGFILDTLTEVPTIAETDVKCITYNSSGTEMCTYEGTRPWLLSGTVEDNSYNSYLNVSILSNTNDGWSTDLRSVDSLDKFTPLEAVLEIQVRESRQCYMTFNATNPKFKAPVKMITYYTEGNENNTDIGIDAVPNGMSRDKHGNWIYKTMKGIDIFQMHKLSWESTASKSNIFLVKLQWLPFIYDNDVEVISNLGVNVQCFWSDYDDIVDVNGTQHARVEDYLDLMKFTAIGVAWTNLRPGVVQGNGFVEI
ncbi:unnamed protein product [Pichia kudriavzevii]